MTRHDVVMWLERIVFGGVAITTEALVHAPGEELTFTQWRALLFVGEDDYGCRVGEVASRLHSSLPTASRLLRRLERRGLLTLERDEEDRRATRARLTPVGVDLRSSVLDYRRNEIAAIAGQVRLSAATDGVLRDLAARFEARGRGETPGVKRASPPDGAG